MLKCQDCFLNEMYSDNFNINDYDYDYEYDYDYSYDYGCLSPWTDHSTGDQNFTFGGRGSECSHLEEESSELSHADLSETGDKPPEVVEDPSEVQEEVAEVENVVEEVGNGPTRSKKRKRLSRRQTILARSARSEHVEKETREQASQSQVT